MIKNNVIIEITKNEKNFQLICPMESPLGDVYDVLYAMRDEVMKIMNQNHDSEAPKKKECNECQPQSPCSSTTAELPTSTQN
jgi:hypothetical protein